VGLLTLEQLRLTGRALCKQQRGAQIIGVGFAAALLGLLVYAAILLSLVEVSQLVLNLFAFPLTCLPPALGISLFLAHEFALGQPAAASQAGRSRAAHDPNPGPRAGKVWPHSVLVNIHSFFA
jgi:hypothetical protein